MRDQDGQAVRPPLKSVAGYELISVLGSSLGKVKPLSSTAEECNAQQGWWVRWGQQEEAGKSCVLCNQSFSHTVLIGAPYIFPKTLRESLQHAFLRSLCPFIYLHFHSVSFFCACSHQSYVQILGYNLLTVASLEIVKFFMVNSFCEHWCNYQWWTSPPSTLESWVIETFMKWAKAARHSECIFKLVSLRGFSIHFYSLDFLLKTHLREGCSGHCCTSVSC